MFPRRAASGAGRKYGFRARTFVQETSNPDAVGVYAPARGDRLTPIILWSGGPLPLWSSAVTTPAFRFRAALTGNG